MVPGAGHGVDPGRSRKGDEDGGGQRPGRPGRPPSLPSRQCQAVQGDKGAGQQGGRHDGEVEFQKQGGEDPPRQGAETFDAVGPGQGPGRAGSGVDIKPRRGGEEETGQQPDRAEGQDGDEELPGEGEISPRHPGEKQAARPDERYGNRQEDRQGEQRRRDGPDDGEAAAAQKGPGGGAQEPDSQGIQIDQLHAVGGDGQLPEEDDLAQQGDQADIEQDQLHGAMNYAPVGPVSLPAARLRGGDAPRRQSSFYVPRGPA